MKTDELETRLREVLRERADRIADADLGRGAPDGDRVVSAPRSAGARRWQGLAVAAVVLVVVALVGAGFFGGQENPAGDRVEQLGQPAIPEVSPWRAWPLNNDEPLPAGVNAEDLRTPETTARAYLSRVVGLPHDWPIANVSNDGDTAVANYILQDVPADIRMARTADGFWYVTGANTDHARPGAPVVTQDETQVGIDISLGAGPRTYEGGAPVRLMVLGANGGLIAGLTGGNTGRIAPPSKAGEAEAAPVASLRWTLPNLPAAVQFDVLSDHDANPLTPDITVGHWATGLAPPEMGLPAGLQMTASEPFFSTEGSAHQVASFYMASRLPNRGPTPNAAAEITVDPPRHRGLVAYARWRDDASSGRTIQGTVALREIGGQWHVVGAATDGVDLSGVSVIDGRIRGRIVTTQPEALYADVVDLDLIPVPGSPDRYRQPTGEFIFGSAGGPAEGSLEIDVPVEPGPALLRVHLFDGTRLSISEVRVTIPPPSR